MKIIQKYSKYYILNLTYDIRKSLQCQSDQNNRMRLLEQHWQWVVIGVSMLNVIKQHLMVSLHFKVFQIAYKGGRFIFTRSWEKDSPIFT